MREYKRRVGMEGIREEEERVRVHSSKRKFIAFSPVGEGSSLFSFCPKDRPRRHALLKVPDKSIKNWLSELLNKGKKKQYNILNTMLMLPL